MKRSILLALCGIAFHSFAGELRLGIVGCDTSHATAFTEILNNPQAKDHVPGARVVAAFKGGSADIPSSASRVDGYVRELTDKYGVRFYETIEELCANVDAVMLESVDGRPHLAQAKPVIAAGKRLYIDKPMAGSLADALEIFRLARENNVPVFSSSSLRFARGTLAARAGQVGLVTAAETTSPCELEPHHPDLFWYGVHGVESLFTVMGVGCESVKRDTTPEGKIRVTGTWKGGRTGAFREDKSYGGYAQGDKGKMDVGAFDGYAPLVREIVKFFETGVAPVPPGETIEIFAFMTAADESKKANGASVAIKDVLRQAEKH